MKVWNLGYPRVGRRRELKKALEAYWSKETSRETLESSAIQICEGRWKRQAELGIDSLPVNDFSYYDQVLDTTYLLGALPKRFEQVPYTHWLDRYFSMGRGYKDANLDIAPFDMTKWFNTNYHYLVPEIDAQTQFALNWDKVGWELDLSRKHSQTFHAVFVGPFTYARLAKIGGMTASDLLPRLLEPYRELLRELKKRGISWVQLDEPALCLDLLKEDIRAVKKFYEDLQGVGPKVLLATYFESPDPWSSEVSNIAVDGIHFDLVHGRTTLEWLKTKSFPRDRVLSLGVVNGRNIWRANLGEVLTDLRGLLQHYSADKVWIAPSCSLLHLPHDKTLEKKWDKEFLSWVSFADQRLEELVVLKKALLGDSASEKSIYETEEVSRGRATSARIHRAEVKKKVERIDAAMKARKSPFEKRTKSQMKHLGLGLLPSTTIGSFPQTQEIRKNRMLWKKGELTDAQYDGFVRKEIETTVRLQEKLGLDVLVHGESERNDMVEYFGELLEGFTFSSNGWVQSYGSRCVKPPILFGDVQRKAPMTVDWFKFSQGLTKKPMKGMLTGPVTILNWSFVREDQSREKTSYQIALAIREEVKDLEAAGAKVIQIDEAAIREGLPIKRLNWGRYLQWATDSFRLCASGVQDHTQIHTHMCYSEFGDIMDAIRRLDADVLLIEYARSGSHFAECFKKYPYENDIGPGVYDIHSPRVPTVSEMEDSLWQILKLFPAERVWVNPDCGLKTRKYEEIEPALLHMVESAKKVRSALQNKGATNSAGKLAAMVTV